MSRPTASLLGFALRVLIAVGCLVPFATPRQLTAAVGIAAPALPPAPVNEEDENEREESVKARAADPRADRRADQPIPAAYLLPPSPVRSRLAATTRPIISPADPFRNGLGTPYRC